MADEELLCLYGKAYVEGRDTVQWLSFCPRMPKESSSGNNLETILPNP